MPDCDSSFPFLFSLFSSFVLFSFILCDDIILILSLFLLYVLSSFIFVLSSQKKKMSSYTRDQKEEMWKAALAPAEVLVGVASFGRECIVGSCIVKIIWITTKLQISKE